MGDQVVLGEGVRVTNQDAFVSAVVLVETLAIIWLLINAIINRRWRNSAELANAKLRALRDIMPNLGERFLADEVQLPTTVTLLFELDGIRGKHVIDVVQTRNMALFWAGMKFIRAADEAAANEGVRWSRFSSVIVKTDRVYTDSFQRTIDLLKSIGASL